MIFLFACISNPIDVPYGEGGASASEWGMIGISEDFEFSEDELMVLDDINSIREDIGLEPLASDLRIGAIARLHSEDMALGEIDLGHEGFHSRIASLYGDIEVFSAAENVASNDTLEDAVDDWLDSSGHADNILGDYNLSGVGVSEDAEGQLYLTQIFILGQLLIPSED